MSYNPAVRWATSISPNCNGYRVDWTLNGAPVLSQTFGSGANSSANFTAANPSTVLHAGDAVGAEVTALDTVNGLSSPPVTATPAVVTIPATPPAPPTSVTLALS